SRRTGLFVNRFGRHLGYVSQFSTFRHLLTHAGIKAVLGQRRQRRPSFHSFRHTFAVRRLALWHHQGKMSKNSCPIWLSILATRGRKTHTGTSPTPPSCWKQPRRCLKDNITRGDRTDDLVGAGWTSSADLLHGLSCGPEACKSRNARQLSRHLPLVAAFRAPGNWRRTRRPHDSIAARRYYSPIPRFSRTGSQQQHRIPQPSSHGHPPLLPQGGLARSHEYRCRHAGAGDPDEPTFESDNT